MSEVGEVLRGLHGSMATDSRDWSTVEVDARLYAVLVGWECEGACTESAWWPQHTCDGALLEVAAQHGWTDEQVAQLRAARAAVRALAE